MKSFLRASAIAVASTALVAGGATAATAAPSQPTALAASSDVSTAGSVSTAVAPYPLERETKIRVKKVGKKLTFRLTARYSDDAGNAVGVRRAYLQVNKGGKWRTIKRFGLNSKGKGTFKRTDGKKRTYRMQIRATSVYQGVILELPRKI